MRTRSLAALATLLAVACAPRADRVLDPTPPPPVATAPATLAPADVLAVTYLANEGFLVEGSGHRVLIDALFGSGIAGYPAVPDTLRGQIERGTGDWSGINLALASHFHGDHFDPAAVVRFLAANPAARFVSTRQAVARLSELTADRSILDRAQGVLPAEGEVVRLEVAGIGLEILNLHHGRRDPPVENLGFVVTLGSQRFLHFGDTEANIEDFEPYLELLADPDVALLPFWFLSSEWRAAMVRERIRPGRVVAAHVPNPDAPVSYFARWESYEQLTRTMLEAFPEAEIPREPGTEIE